MKCVCGYDDERGDAKFIRLNPLSGPGERPSLRSRGLQDDPSVLSHGLVACPKCGTLRLTLQSSGD
jgi:hypothetical protein